jgi:flagellar basal body rod protein FlgB
MVFMFLDRSNPSMTDTPKSQPSKAQVPALTTASDTNASDTNEITVRRLAAKLQSQQVAHQAQVAVLTKKLDECRDRYARQGALLSNQIATILERIDAIRRSLSQPGKS